MRSVLLTPLFVGVAACGGPADIAPPPRTPSPAEVAPVRPPTPPTMAAAAPRGAPIEAAAFDYRVYSKAPEKNT